MSQGGLAGKKVKRKFSSAINPGGLIALGGGSSGSGATGEKQIKLEVKEAGNFKSKGPKSPTSSSEADCMKLASSILNCDVSDTAVVVAKLNEALLMLSGRRSNPSQSLLSAVLWLTKKHSSKNLIDEHQTLYKSVLQIFGAAPTSLKQKPCNPVVTLACEMIMLWYRDVENWPLAFFKIFVEDCLGEREITADLQCLPDGPIKEFLTNILYSIPLTNLPLNYEISFDDPEYDVKQESGKPRKLLDRFASSEVKAKVVKFAVDSVNSTVNQKLGGGGMGSQQETNNMLKNVIQLMTVICGIKEIRALACSKLDAWIHNSKMLKPAQDLFVSVCLNIRCDSEDESDVFSSLMKLKPKTKIVSGIITSGFKEMATKSEGACRILMRNLVFNEFSGPNRNANNMPLLCTLFQNMPDQVTKYLAHAFQFVLSQKEDFTKAVRSFFREIVKALKNEIKYSIFCRELIDTQKEVQVKLEAGKADPGFVVQYFTSIADVTTYAWLICVPLPCRETPCDSKILKTCHEEMRSLQNHLLFWVTNIVTTYPQCFDSNSLRAILQKIFLFDHIESYFRQDPYPQDKALCYNLIIGAGTLESCVLEVLRFGVATDIPLGSSEAVSMVEGLVLRSPLGSIIISNVEKFFEALIGSAAYVKPVSISLPNNYNPPKLAVAAVLWKCWSIITVLSAGNTQTVAKYAWEHYPILKILLEMALTADFTFPPQISDIDKDELQHFELRTREKEKNDIITFECHLAGKTITEETSLLISQLMFLESDSLPRQPPAEFLLHIKGVCSSLKIGNALCNSRENDYLLNIIQRNKGVNKGGSTWLNQIVLTAEDVTTLPVECLCEFLLTHGVLMENPDTEPSSHLQAFNAITAHFQQTMHVHIGRYEMVYTLKILKHLLNGASDLANFDRRSYAIGLLSKLFTHETVENTSDSSVFQSIVTLLNKFDDVSTQAPDVLETIVTSALNAFASEMENFGLILSAFSFLFSVFSTERLSLFQKDFDRKHLISFCEVFIDRPSIVETCFERYSSSVLPSVNYLVSKFPVQSGDSNWPILKLGENDLSAPNPVIGCLYSLVFLTGDPQLELILLKNVSFDSVEPQLADWVLIRACIFSSQTVCNWLKSSFNLSIECLQRIENYSFVDGSLQNLVQTRILEIDPGYAKFSGASKENTLSEDVKENEKMDVSAHQDSEEDGEEEGEIQEPMEDSPVGAASDGDIFWSKLVQYLHEDPDERTSFMNIELRFSEFDDWRDFCECIVSSLEKFGREESEKEKVLCTHKLADFILSVAKRLSFGHLNYWNKSLTKLCNAKNSSDVLTKLKSSVTFLESFVDETEKSMQPKSPEPEVKVSLRAKSLLDAAKSKTGKITKKKFNLTGKILDLLQTNDPEVIKRQNDYIWQVIFSRDSVQSYTKTMLSLLVHGAKWDTICCTVDKILSGLDENDSEHSFTEVNPSAVLDFLAASLILQPKLSHGQDIALINKIGYHCMYPFDLETDSPKILGLLFLEAIRNSNENATSLHKDVLSTLQSRIALYLKLFSGENQKYSVGQLMAHTEQFDFKKIGLRDTFPGRNKALKESAKILIYLNTAVKTQTKPDFDKVSSANAILLESGGDYRFGDTLPHELLVQASTNSSFSINSSYSLTCFNVNKDSVDLCTSLLTSFSSIHPKFVLRQLELIAILLKGRLRSSWGAFKKEGHADFCRMCVRVMRRLAPGIFSHESFSNIMDTVLSIYSNFSANLTNHYFQDSRDEVLHLVNSLFETNFQLAVKLLRPYENFYIGSSSQHLNKTLINCLLQSEIKDGFEEKPFMKGVSSQVSSNFGDKCLTKAQCIHRNLVHSDINRCRKFFIGKTYQFNHIPASCSPEKTLNYIKALQEYCHDKEKNLESVVDAITPVLTYSNSEEVIEKGVMLLLSLCKQSSGQTCSKTAQCLVDLLRSGKMSHGAMNRVFSLYSMDLLLVHCSNNGGLDILTALFDANIAGATANSDEHLKKILNSLTLNQLLS